MTAHTLHPLAEEYLDRLDDAADHLPRARRNELVADIQAHLVEALGTNPTESDVLTVLDRLGAPEEIAEAEQPRSSAAPERDPRGLQEWAAIILLLLGGFVVGVGWIAGLILLWSSRAWNTRDKLIGSLLWPGGLVVGAWFATAYLVSASEVCMSSPGQPAQCTSDSGNALAVVPLVVALLVPVATSIYLARRARRAPRKPRAL